MRIQTRTDTRKERSVQTIVGLVLAFVPSAIFLSLKNGDRADSLAPACLFSLICCFISSSMLFHRGAIWSVLLGMLFLMLNLAIGFFLGCAALVGGSIAFRLSTHLLMFC